MEYLIYRKDNGLCVDSIVWDGISDINIYPDYDLVKILENTLPIPSIGWWFIDGRLIEPSPFPSWQLDQNYEWVPPYLPTNVESGEEYEWDEEKQQWVLIN